MVVVSFTKADQFLEFAFIKHVAIDFELEVFGALGWRLLLLGLDVDTFVL